MAQSATTARALLFLFLLNILFTFFSFSLYWSADRVIDESRRSDAVQTERFRREEMELKQLRADVTAAVLDLKHNSNEVVTAVRGLSSQEQRIAAMSRAATSQPPLGVQPVLSIQDSEKQAKVAESLESDNQKVWMMIGIPTVPRKDQDYLTPTIESFVDELPNTPTDLLWKQVKVVIMNNAADPSTHLPFLALQHRFSNHHKGHFFEFVTNTHKLLDDDPTKQDGGTPNKPGWKVRAQTRDFVSMLRYTADKSQYFLTMEDDFLMCKNGFLALQYIIQKAGHTHPEWSAVRMSYGLTGILLKGSDLSWLSEYLYGRHRDRPPDHLMVEWMAGEKPATKEYLGRRRNLAFRWNLLNHIGLVSTLRPQKSPSYPKCWEPLQEPTNFAVESFDRKQCPYDDLWPCNLVPNSGSTTTSTHNALFGFTAYPFQREKASERKPKSG